MDGVILTSLNKIYHPNGDIFHALKHSESTYEGFEEAYFTTINHGCVKGWKKHLRMTMNLIVPVGLVKFYIRDDLDNRFSIELGDHNYQRLTVAPGLWMAFAGFGESLNLILNISDIQHDPDEAINMPIETYQL